MICYQKELFRLLPVFKALQIKKQLTTLGKGGSDTTAALMAAAIGADRADIYTDVMEYLVRSQSSS